MLDAIPNSEFQGKKERKGAGNTRKYRSSRMFHIAWISSRTPAKRSHKLKHRVPEIFIHEMDEKKEEKSHPFDNLTPCEYS